jgi:hypothetical protein
MKHTIKLTIGAAIAAAVFIVSQGRGLALEDSARPASAVSLPVLAQIAPVSTVPANGDLNPYGVAFVPAGFPAGGTIQSGDILTFVSQFPVDTVPGAAFGIALETIGGGFAQFAAVDDNTNSVTNFIVQTR